MNITIQFNQQEHQMFLALLDLAVKQGGLNAVDAVAHFKHKLTEAAKPQVLPEPGTAAAQ